eukprot:COSAG03_NODE_2392_length_2815_cov_2.981222_1_plen_88_part_10
MLVRLGLFNVAAICAVHAQQPTAAGVPSSRRLNVATLECLPAAHALAPNQGWRAVELPSGSLSRSLSSPLLSYPSFVQDVLDSGRVDL